MSINTDKHEGLADVVAAISSICSVDGDLGVLRYCGIDIKELATRSTFEETVYLLWNGRLPRASDLKIFDDELALSRDLSPPLLQLLTELPSTVAPMDMLRTGLSLMSFYDPDGADMSPEANKRKAMRLVAQTPTLVATIDAISQARTPVKPRSDLSLAANFLYMLSGAEQSDLAVHALDVALILHADHELNASTFVARVTAATLADMYSAVVAAVCALKGPLHGGANEDVSRMLHAIAIPENAKQFVTDRLSEKGKIPGFGHRVYHTIDPRASVLKDLSRQLGAAQHKSTLFDISIIVEGEVFAGKQLYPNVDFYSASVYETLGIPPRLFTPLFAASRMAGWTAHVLEQYGHNKLIRPRADYVGIAEAPYVPVTFRE